MHPNLYDPTSDYYYQPTRSLLTRLHIDPLLLLALLGLIIYGFIILYSASNQDNGMLLRQAIRIGVGFTLMILVAQVPPDSLQRWALLFYIVCSILLLLVLLIGTESKGAKRWLTIPGVMRFQPSELMKLALPMLICAFLAQKGLPPTPRSLLLSALAIFIPVTMIVMQPDLGTSILIGSSGLIVLLLAGLPVIFIISFILLSIPSAFGLWYLVMHDYQRQRVLTFLNPESDPLGAGWNIIQSTTAIGSGGAYGKGWLNGTQSHLDFLPESSTDFIIAVLAEEFGLLGVLGLLVLYLAILARGIFISLHAQDNFSRLLAATISYTVFVYIFVNIGMVSGILPVVGVPLPLISYGGTSIVTLMIGFGLLMSIQTHKRSLRI